MKPDDRARMVRDIFSRAVTHYDLLNHILSLRRDVFWRKATAGKARPFNTHRLLDVACGTGDLTLALKQAHPQAQVIGTDFTFPMLKQAGEKIKTAKHAPVIDLCSGDALKLPFRDRFFDCATMAFGIRNIPDRSGAFEEMERVLVPGGRALILELTFPKWSFIRKFYNTYLNRLLPRIGGLISGNAAPYQYLADSIMDFPEPQALCHELAAAGFYRTGYITYNFGICVLHWGIKEPG